MRCNHTSEEVLERYSMGNLPEVVAATLEEHLLICPVCQDRLKRLDEFIAAMRAAAVELA